MHTPCRENKFGMGCFCKTGSCRANFCRSGIETSTENMETGTEIALKEDNAGIENTKTDIQIKETSTEMKNVVHLINLCGIILCRFTGHETGG